MSDSTTNQRSPIRAPPHILQLLEHLRALSLAQEAEIEQAKGALVELHRTNPTEGHRALDKLMSDKFVALEKEKCEFVYQLILATGAKNVVEAGTSYGVSTIYLALAVGQNSSDGRVIATEKEPEKVVRAREYWAEAGEAVTNHVDIRQGDLLMTLQQDVPSIDLLLLDIWSPLALPTLKLLQPRMRRGTVIVTDNTVSASAWYREFLQYLNDPDSPFRSLTVPYSGGLELSLFLP